MKTVSGDERESQVRVPAIVFDYPRHSGATDEGMTNGPSTFAYLAFRSRRDTIEGIHKAPEDDILVRPRDITWRAR
jgi:hypothetical protein